MSWSEFFRFIYILGFVNAFFFSILIFSKSNKKQADKILGSWLIALGFQLFIPFLYLANFNKYIEYVGYEALFFSAQPVFLFLYIKSLTRKVLSTKEILIHFIWVPFVAASLLPFVFFSYEQRLELFNTNNFPLSIIPGFILICAVIGFYLFKSFSLLKKHKNQTLHVYSYRDNVDLMWLRRLLVSFTIILALSVPIGMVLYVKNISLAYTDYIFYVALVAFIFLLAYWGYQQGAIFSLNKPITHEPNTSAHSVEKEYQAEVEALSRVMDKEKPYLDPTLTIHQLANQTNIPPHVLSRVINKCFKQNFFEYTNHYRINHFKNLCSHPKFKSYTLLALAYESGFNSKSAFNRIFKDYTGLTPGQFKKQTC